MEYLKNKNNRKLFFIHLKLEIALAIPGSNVGKIFTSNSAAQGLELLGEPNIWAIIYVNL